MLIAVVLLSYFLFMALIVIGITFSDMGYGLKDFLAAYLLIFVMPVWAVIAISLKYKARRKRKKQNTELQEKL